jgi:hypothetical protein
MNNVFLVELAMKIGQINLYLDFAIRILVIIILILGIRKLTSKK